MDNLDHLASRPADEVTTIYWEWAPAFARVTHPIAAPGGAMLHPGTVVEIEVTPASQVLIRLDAGLVKLDTWQLTHSRERPGNRPDAVLELIEGDEWQELLEQRGGWTLPDGTEIVFTRADGPQKVPGTGR